MENLREAKFFYYAHMREYDFFRGLEVRKWANERNDIEILNSIAGTNPMMYIKATSTAIRELKRDFYWVGACTRDDMENLEIEN